MAIIPNDEKVFMVSNTTNTTYSGSQALKDMNEWYTMEDIKNTVLPYKVYTALLTQSGGDESTGIYSGPVTKGVTYEIVKEDGDYSNVGAPNNNAGTFFLATNNEIPNSYGSGALIYNTGAPVVTVLENTIGNIYFTYNDTGIYNIIITNFNILKTYSNIGMGDSTQIYDEKGWVKVFSNSESISLYIKCFDSKNDLVNDMLKQTPIEIRVYN